MHPRIAFCSRCRGMKVGWNKRYIFHWLLCKRWLRNSSRLASLALLTAALLLTFPEPSAYVFSDGRPEHPIQEAGIQASALSVGLAVGSMDTFLKRNEVREANRSRLAKSIETSARKYNLNPRLIASIMIVESRGNPFAITGKNAIGIMQIHLPTWGYTADREGINLFKIEDNIDFGARILKNYIRQFGLWEGVKRYNGLVPDDPTSQQSAQEYVAKVQRVYELEQPAASQANLLE
jgi:soluble lytic murein transglycosylase-like protein